MANGETYKDIWNSLSDTQKDMVYYLIGVAKKASQDLDEETPETDINHSELRHYGVLGQKCGVRRYQNPDGSLTPAGKRRYGDVGKYEYQSLSTKAHQTALKKADRDLENTKSSGQSKRAQQAAADKVKKMESMLKKSKKLDAKYLDYSKRTSTGKAIAQNLLFGPWASRVYQQSRANDVSRLKSAALALGSNLLGGPLGSVLVARGQHEYFMRK